MNSEIVTVNRAPVLTLWAAIVAERLGYDHEAALSLGKSLAGLTAQTKGQNLGIYKPAEKPAAAKKFRAGEEFRVELLGRLVPATNTAAGVRALCKDRTIEPDGVERYLESKFGESLDTVVKAMTALAKAFAPEDLAAKAYNLYERFRPAIPPGVQGWGAHGELDLSLIRSLASGR